MLSAGDTRIETAVDDALRAAEFEVVPVEWAGFDLAMQCFTAIFFAEAWASNRALIQHHPDEVGPDVATALSLKNEMGAGRADLQEMLATSTISLLELFDRVELVALPTMPIFPPRVDQISAQTLLPLVVQLSSLTAPFNPAGVPCTAQPVPAAGSSLPASLQLVGPRHSEELLVSADARVEQAVLATRVQQAEMLHATGPAWPLLRRPVSASSMTRNRSAPWARVVPVLAVTDVRAAVAWYSEVLGLVEHVRIGEAHRAQLGVDAERAEIIEREYPKGETRVPGAHQVMVRVDDVQAVLDAARTAGADADEKPNYWEYGERQAAFVDPFGHEWVLTQTLRDVDPEDWGGTTVVPRR